MKTEVQCNSKNIYFFTGNHNSIDGIKDHYDILSEILKQDNIKLIISENIKVNNINILVEEFSNRQFVKNIAEIKNRFKNTRYIFVATEFITKNKFGYTLNGFYNELFFSLVVNLAVKYLSIKNNKKNKNNYLSYFVKKTFSIPFLFAKFILKSSLIYPVRFLKKTIRLLVKILKYLDKIIAHKFLKSRYASLKDFIKSRYASLKNNYWSKYGIFAIYAFMKDIIWAKYGFFALKAHLTTYFWLMLNKSHFYRKFYYAVYMKLRFNGFESILDFADLILTFHPQISADIYNIYNKDSLSVYPLINKKKFKVKNKVEDNLSLVCTGNSTPYREEIIKKLNSEIRSSNNKLKIYKKGFLNIDEFKLYDGLLTIPQSADWQYSSPVRIWRSVNANILPISYKQFYDHDIETLSIKFNVNLKIKEILEHYNLKIRTYNNIAYQNNRKIILSIKSLA